MSKHDLAKTMVRAARSGAMALAAAFAYASWIGAASPAAAQSTDKYEAIPKPQVRPAAPTAPPRTAPAAPTKPQAPADQQPAVAELKRKATAKEAEDGICGRINWPTLSVEDIKTNFDRAAADGTSAWLFAGRTDLSCRFTRHLAVSAEDGRRCIRQPAWQCTVGKTCGYWTQHLCKYTDGTFSRKDGYGALAMSRVTAWGQCVLRGSKEDAEQCAMSNCGKYANDCKILCSFDSECITLAMSGGDVAQLIYGAVLDDAAALAARRKDGGDAYKVVLRVRSGGNRF